MKNLGIFCNFGFGPISIGGSVGGSEQVIKSISEHLAKYFDYKINIYGHNYTKVYIVGTLLTYNS